MNPRFAIQETPQPVPPGASEADPMQAMRDLYRRVARLERELEQERQRAAEATGALLATLIDVQEQLDATIRRFGVTTSAQEAGLVRRVVELARIVQEGLAQHQISPIETVGRPLDEATSTVVAVEQAPTTPPGIVLREVRSGYRWPRGVIRRAEVVVSGASPGPASRQDTNDQEEHAQP